MKRRSMLAVGSAALLCAQLVTASCGDGSTIAAGDTADVAADVLFPDVPMDTQVPDTEVPDTAVPDTAVPDTEIPDTAVPDTAVPDTAVPDTEQDTLAGDTQTPPAYVDWCRLQWPLDLTVGATTPVDVYGRVFVSGLTDLTPGADASANLVAKVGFGAAGSAPADWTSWFDAAPTASWNGTTAGAPTHDEYKATIPSFLTVGDRDFAFAFSYDGGQHWTYCDRDAGAGKDGSADGYHATDAGHAEVVANPCATNPCTTPPSRCEAGKLYRYASPGACADNAGQAACDYGTATMTDCAAQGDFCNPATLACVDDVCNPNPCTVTPDPICDGNQKVTYTAPGTCSDATGTSACTYAEASRTACAGAAPFCVRGDCRAWRLAGVGDLRITEIMVNPEKVADSAGEWFEVQNITDVAVNLWGLVVEDDNADDFTVATDVIVAPGAFAVLGRNNATGTNGGVTVQYVYTGMTLSNDADTLRILRGTETVDEVAWSAGWPLAASYAMGLDPAATDSDVTQWCKAKTAYNDKDFGTPGMPNDACRLTGLWCRLQWPLEATVLTASTVNVFGRVYVAGVTDATAGVDAHPLLVGAAGFGPADAAPSTWTSWTAATGNAAPTSPEANNDEYQAALTAPAAGSYALAFRFSGDGGHTWTYCDKNAGAASDGSQDGFTAANAGALTVVANPCTPNPCTTPPSGCTGTTLSTYAAPGTCTVSGTAASCDYGAPTTVDCAASSKVCDAVTLSCVTDPCTPNPCTAGKPATCDGNAAVTYAATGTCAAGAAGAECTYAEANRQDCGAETCLEGACRDWRFVAAGDLLITEIMPNPDTVTDELGEWFEVKNVSTAKLNLRGLTIVDNNPTSGAKTLSADLFVAPGAFVVFGKSIDTAVNGNVTVAVAMASGFGLANSNDLVTLKVGDVVIDEVNYGSTGLALTVPTGASLQLHADATDNGTKRDWCAGAAIYNTTTDGTKTDKGTPGAANGKCWLPVGWCRLQHPAEVTLAPTAAYDAFGRLYVAGVTDQNTTGNDANALLRAAFGVALAPAADSDPATWTWTAAAANAGYGVASPGFEANNDEWTATLAAPAAPGAHRLAFRVSGDAGQTWTTCDLDKRASGGADGSADGFTVANAGALTVTDPCSPNPCTTAPNACAGEVLSTYAAPGTCTVNGATFACNYGTATTTDCAAAGDRCNPAAPGCVECLGQDDCAAPFETCALATHSCEDACVEDDFEPNDAIATAHAFATDAITTDLVLCAGNADYYKVTLAAGQTLSVLVEFALVGATEGVELVLYGPSGAVVASDLGVGATGSVGLDHTAATAGVYTFGVSGEATLKGTYDLTVLFSTDPCAINPCTNPPAPVCSGDDLVTAPSPGACDGSTGSAVCDYTGTTTTACPAFCNFGACTSWRYPDAAGELVVTEVFADASLGAAAAWFEVHNTTTDPLNLDGLEVFDLGTDTFTVDGDVIVAPGDYFVFGASSNAGANGGVTVDYVWTGFSLDAAGDEIALSWLGSLDLDDVAWDATWPRAADKSASLDPDVVLTGAAAATANDLAANWCLGTAAFGGGAALGTPGAANSDCLATWTIGWCRMQHPPTLAGAVGDALTVYARVYVAGLTPVNLVGNDPHASVIGQVGYGTPDTLPTAVGWVWPAAVAAPTAGYGPSSPNFEANNDEYAATLTAPAAGSYDYAFRFSGDGGLTWVYCDLAAGVGADGSENGYQVENAGVMTVSAPAAPAVFISEYVEGSSSNKAIEIYNGTGAAWDLAAHSCKLRLYVNGAATPGSPIALTGVIADKGTWAICNTSATTALKNLCAATSGSLSHTGNDAIEFICDDVVLDFFGVIQAADFAANQTLQRKCGINQGAATWSLADWNVLASDTFTGIGNHTTLCQ